MDSIRNALIGAKIKAAVMTQSVLNKVATKKTGDETLIVKIMLMVVAVVLVIIFRDELTDLIKGMVANITDWINDMYQT